MGLFDSAVGALLGGGTNAASLEQGLGALLEQHGGVAGLVNQLSQGGLGSQVSSWVGNGQNQSVTANEISQALGSGSIGAFAQKLGLNPQQASEVLSQALPHLIDHLTPGGQVPANATQSPAGDVLAAAARSIASRLFG